MMKVFRQVASLPRTRVYVGEVDDSLLHWQAVVLTLGLPMKQIISGRKVNPRFAYEKFWLLVTHHSKFV